MAEAFRSLAKMKEMGKLFCSGAIVEKRPGDGVLRKPETYAQSILGCRHHVNKAHWHIVYEGQDGHVFIGWDNFEDEAVNIQ